MKQVKCEMCGSTDMIKENGAFVCQSCGMKYSVEEAKKLMIDGVVEVKGTVQVDSSSDIDNWYVLASREKTWEKKIDYYRRIVEKDANSAPAYLCVALDKYIQTIEIKTYKSWTDSPFNIDDFNKKCLIQLDPLPIDAFSESQILDFAEDVAKVIDRCLPTELTNFRRFREYLDAVCDKYKVLHNLLMRLSGKKQLVDSSNNDISILHDEDVSNLLIKKLHENFAENLRCVFHSVFYDSCFISDIQHEYEEYLEDMKEDYPDEEYMDFEEYKEEFKKDYEKAYKLMEKSLFLNELRLVINKEVKHPINPLSDSDKIEIINQIFDNGIEKQNEKGSDRWSVTKDGWKLLDLTCNFDLLNIAERIDPNYTHPFIEKDKSEVKARQEKEQKQRKAEKDHIKRLIIYKNVIRFVAIVDLIVFFVRFVVMHIPIISEGFLFYVGQLFVLMLCGACYLNIKNRISA